MAINVCKYCLLKSCNGSSYLEDGCPPKLKHLLKILKKYVNHYKCNVNFLLDELLISPLDLNFLTKNYFGCYAKILVENLKLEIALNNLESSRDIYKIAYTCGYSHTRTLKKVFIRRFNMSFDEYKSKLLKSSNQDIFRKHLINGLWSSNFTKKPIKLPVKIPIKKHLTDTYRDCNFEKEVFK